MESIQAVLSTGQVEVKDTLQQCEVIVKKSSLPPTGLFDKDICVSTLEIECIHRVSKRLCIAALHQFARWSTKQISNALNVSKKTVLKWHEINTSDVANFKDAPRLGRPMALAPHVMEWILRTIREPGQSVPSICRALPLAFAGLHVSEKCVRRCLKEAGYIWKFPRDVPLLTEQHRKKRVSFCKHWICVRPEVIANIVFTDEKNFRLFGPTTGGWVPLGVPLVHPAPKNSVRVLVWGGVGWHGKTPLYIAQDAIMDTELYISVVLEKIWKPYRALVEGEKKVRLFLTQDGAPPHTSHRTKAWHEEEKTMLVHGPTGKECSGQWPPNSPDINGPIENVWGDMAVHVGSSQPSSVDALVSAIKEAWEVITTDRIRAAIVGWQNRLRWIVEHDGYIYCPDYAHTTPEIGIEAAASWPVRKLYKPRCAKEDGSGGMDVLQGGGDPILCRKSLDMFEDA